MSVSTNGEQSTGGGPQPPSTSHAGTHVSCDAFAGSSTTTVPASHPVMFTCDSRSPMMTCVRFTPSMPSCPFVPSSPFVPSAPLGPTHPFGGHVTLHPPVHGEHKAFLPANVSSNTSH